jgi:hypothetical protein
LRAGYREIGVEYAELDDGARLVCTTSDDTLVVTLHAWFDRQTMDHSQRRSAGQRRADTSQAAPVMMTPSGVSYGSSALRRRRSRPRPCLSDMIGRPTSPTEPTRLQSPRRSTGGGSVGLYREHVLPRLVDRACGTGELRRWRKQATAGLFGTVVEIGFGSGLNMPAYPPVVNLVYAVEPAATARRLARNTPPGRRDVTTRACRSLRTRADM